MRLGKDDHLFLYVIDHGGTDDAISNSYICLWNNERLYDYELANMLAPFCNKFVNVNVVLGQCYSGGFIDDLKKVGCVVATASSGSESSYGCGDIPYDEFVYQWTCAVNGATHNNIPINADKDANGRVTMLEAFNYAKSYDRDNREHPQYASTPKSVGEDLSFNHLAPSIDLYIKDNTSDTGKEPNTSTNEFWKSPSIWVRNYKDGLPYHENPFYSEDHPYAFVNVRIHNRGKEDFDGKGKWLIIYWAQASTGLTAKAWKGRELFGGKYATGGSLEAISIEPIKAGGFWDVTATWALPQSIINQPEGEFHYCLLAKIMDTPYDDGYVDGKSYFNIIESNKEAQRNITIIRSQDLSKAFNVYVRNVSSAQQAYSLEIIDHTNMYIDGIFSKAKIEMEMSPKIYAAWERGGLVAQNIELPEPNSAGNAMRKVNFISQQSKLKNITLKGDEFDVVKVKCNFNSYSQINETFTIDLVQKDLDGNIIGGETFEIEAPRLTLNPLLISSNSLGDGKYELELIDSDYEVVRWENSEGKIVGEEQTVVVFPKAGDECFSVVAMNEEGDVAIQKILFENENVMSSVSMNGPDLLEIRFNSGVAPNSAVSLISVIDGDNHLSCMVPEGDESISIAVNNLSKGLYIVAYTIDGIMVDEKRIQIH